MRQKNMTDEQTKKKGKERILMRRRVNLWCHLGCLCGKEIDTRKEKKRCTHTHHTHTYIH